MLIGDVVLSDPCHHHYRRWLVMGCSWTVSYGRVKLTIKKRFDWHVRVQISF